MVPVVINNILSGLRIPVDCSQSTRRAYENMEPLGPLGGRAWQSQPLKVDVFGPSSGLQLQLNGEDFQSNPKGYTVISLSGSVRTVHTERALKTNDLSVWK